MYLQHFGLTEYPFGLTPNTQFFCALPVHREALNVLLVALHSGEGFIKITGEVGTGKTMLCRKLLNELEQGFVTAYIPNPALAPRELLVAVADELGVRLRSSFKQGYLLKLINRYLLEVADQGKRLVLVLDEAQAIPPDTLELLRLLTNLETESRKLLQIVLFGQPELDVLLSSPSFRQLQQRITFSYRLRALGRGEIQHYLFNRLRVAGCAERDLFSRPAYWLIYFYSRGIPRLINILAHKSLMAAYGKGSRLVKVRDVRAAAADTEGVRGPGRLFPRRWLVGLVLAAGAGAAAITWSGTALP